MANVIAVCVAFLLAYAIPGFTVLSMAVLPVPIRLLLSVPIGIVMWGWQGWVFGFLHMRSLSYAYVCLAVLMFVRIIMKDRRMIGKGVRELIRRADLGSIAIMTLGVLAQSLMVWNMFVPYKGTVALCCIDPNDAIWYASITKSILNSFPPDYPGIVGQTLHNYHYWSQLVVADIVRVFGVDQMPMQFRYTGILLSFYLGVTAVTLVSVLGLSVAVRRWLLFFLYFGGDALYIVPFIRDRVLGFSGSSMEDGIRFLGNPPRSFAVMLAFAWLTIWIAWKDKLTLPRIIVLGLLLSGIIGFKVYVGIFLIVGLSAVALWEALRRRFSQAWLLLAVILLGSTVYLPVNAQAGGLIYTGFWRFDNFIVQPGLGMIRFELARKIFEQDHKVAKVLVFEWFYVFVYVVTIFGTKLLGFFQTGKSLRSVPLSVHIFFGISLLVNFVIGGFFLQTTGGGNTFNFHVNIFIFLSLYAAIGADALLSKFDTQKVFRTFLFCLVVIFTIPRASEVVRLIGYATVHLQPVIPLESLPMLMRIRGTEPGSRIAVKSQYFPKDTGTYMYFLADRPQYLTSAEFLTQFGADTFDRERNLNALTSVGTPSAQRRIVLNEDIRYMLLDTEVGRYIATASAYGLTPVESSPAYTLYKTDAHMIR